MQRHCANGMAVAQFLENHPKVAYVNYCGLESSPYHALAQKYLPNGSCGVVSFGLAGGRQAASTFMKELKLAAIETHVADARTWNPPRISSPISRRHWIRSDAFP